MFENVKSWCYNSLYGIMYYMTWLQNSCMNIGTQLYEEPQCRSLYDGFHNIKYGVCHDCLNTAMENPNDYCGLFSIIPSYKEWFNTQILNPNNMTDVIKDTKEMITDINDLLIVKYNNITLYRTIQSKSEIIPSPNPVQNYFLTIEYSHKNMDDKIEIFLDKTDLFENNEILSYTFIYKYLMYLQEPFKIDNDYVIHIIDKNLEPVQIKYNNYIILKSNCYEIAFVNNKTDLILKQK